MASGFTPQMLLGINPNTALQSLVPDYAGVLNQAQALRNQQQRAYQDQAFRQRQQQDALQQQAFQNLLARQQEGRQQQEFDLARQPLGLNALRSYYRAAAGEEAPAGLMEGFANLPQGQAIPLLGGVLTGVRERGAETRLALRQEAADKRLAEQQRFAIQLEDLRTRTRTAADDRKFAHLLTIQAKSAASAEERIALQLEANQAIQDANFKHAREQEAERETARTARESAREQTRAAQERARGIRGYYQQLSKNPVLKSRSPQAILKLAEQLYDQGLALPAADEPLTGQPGLPRVPVVTPPPPSSSTTFAPGSRNPARRRSLEELYR